MKICKLEVCDVKSSRFESLCYESLQVGSLLHRTNTCFESLCCEKFVSWKIGLFDIGQPLLTYFNLYAPTRLVFLILFGFFRTAAAKEHACVLLGTTTAATLGGGSSGGGGTEKA